MQTFLPFPSFVRSARVLDRPRLGKQRIEVLQLVRALVGDTEGYRNHPAALMWEDAVPALGAYGLAVCREWRRRGYTDNIAAELQRYVVVPSRTLSQMQRYGDLPWWMGSRTFHRAHRSNLLRKAPAHYDTIFPGEPDDLPYAWPTHRPGVFRFKHAGEPWLTPPLTD